MMQSQRKNRSFQGCNNGTIVRLDLIYKECNQFLLIKLSRWGSQKFCLRIDPSFIKQQDCYFTTCIESVAMLFEVIVEDFQKLRISSDGIIQFQIQLFFKKQVTRKIYRLQTIKEKSSLNDQIQLSALMEESALKDKKINLLEQNLLNVQINMKKIKTEWDLQSNQHKKTEIMCKNACEMIKQLQSDISILNKRVSFIQENKQYSRDFCLDIERQRAKKQQLMLATLSEGILQSQKVETMKINMNQNKLSSYDYWKYWDPTTPYAYNYKITENIVERTTSEIKFYQVVSFPLPRTGKFTANFIYEYVDKNSMCVGLITQDRKNEQSSSGNGDLMALTYNSDMNYNNGCIFMDNQQIVGWTSQLVVPHGSLLKMEINVDDQIVTFTNVCNGRQVIIKLASSFNNKQLLVYVTMWTKGRITLF